MTAASESKRGEFWLTFSMWDDLSKLRVNYAYMAFYAAELVQYL